MRILPLGDIQLGADGCDTDRLEKHIKWGLKHGCEFIGLGDYVDAASPSNRRKLREVQGDLYDSVRDMFDEVAEQKLKALQKILAPTRGRWRGLVSGHHFWEFQDGTTTDTRLAQFLGTKYMGDGAAQTILQFRHQSGLRNFQYGVCRIWYHHGQGMGSTLGAALNKLDRISGSFLANIYLIGHYHTKTAAKRPFIVHDVTSNGRILDRSFNRILASTGGFLKGYELGSTDPYGNPSASYVERNMLVPTALGGDLLLIRPRLKEGRIHIDCDISL